MNQLKLINQAQEKGKKVGRKVKLAISTLSSEERLDSLADIVIERILEENKTPKLSAALTDKGDLTI
jgi:hypothetical protein